MPVTRTFSKSFGAGEISPAMFGRLDDKKYQAGAATMRNFISKPQGPAENRSGFKFVKEVKDSTKKTRLLSFTFNTTQTMVIEMGHEYFRFHTQGATLNYSTPANWSNNISYEIGDLVQYGGVNYYAKTQHLSLISNQPSNTSPYWYPLPADMTYEIPHDYQESIIFDVQYVQSADVMTLVHPDHPPKELRRLGATTWTLTNINFGSPLQTPTNVVVAITHPTSASTNVDTYVEQKYVVTAIASNLIDESEQSSVGLKANGVIPKNNLNISGAINTITWNAVSSASRYRVYKEQGGIYGFIGETPHDSVNNPASYSIVDDNISPDFSLTPPIYENEFSSTSNYPGAISYFEQRRVFAGTTNNPQTIIMTKSGTESNLSFSLPIRDDDRIKFRVAAREANTIRHIVPLTQLLLLTGSAEWRVTSVNSDAITPTSISVKPQSYVGASTTQPVIVNNSMVYCAARGGHIRELGYNWQANGFITGDLSLRSAHLFDNFQITDMTFSKAPIPIVYFVNDQGKLLGLTYVPEQAVGAWHQHDTDGVFESVASVAEGDDDVVYCVIKRTINGATKRYVERMGTRLFATQRDSFFVDCGATYNGVNTDTNQTVTISGGTNYTKGESVTITTNYNLFNAPPSVADKDDAIVIVDGATVYRLTIISTTSQTVATGKLDKDLPAPLQNTAITTFEVARNGFSSGLSHLEGKTVSILADGAVHPQRVVNGGAISLNRACSVVHIGLPYKSDLQTLPLQLQTEALGQGRVKNINHVWLRVFESSGIFAGPSADKLVEAKQRTTEPYGTPPNLKTEDIKLMLTPTWQDNGQIFVRQTDPLPLTIVGLTIEVAIGG